MDALVNILLEGKKVVFVTGAGLSVSSGIPPYRGKANAVWEHFVLEWGTRRKFKKDPLEWWNRFWLKTHEKPLYLKAKPNRGHEAIAHLARRCPQTCVITQNVDTLHCKTPLLRSEQLVEVHGHLGFYKCINSSCKGMTENLELDIKKYDKRLSNQSLNSGEDVTGEPISKPKPCAEDVEVEVEQYQLDGPPLCPHCAQAVLPQALLFDEEYESHTFYQWDKVHTWLHEAAAIVFVGTSFSVGVTCNALEEASKGQKRVFNFNLRREDIERKLVNNRGRDSATEIISNLDIVHIGGKAEQSLTMLAWAVDRTAHVQQMLRQALHTYVPASLADTEAIVASTLPTNAEAHGGGIKREDGADVKLEVKTEAPVAAGGPASGALAPRTTSLTSFEELPVWSTFLPVVDPNMARSAAIVRQSSKRATTPTPQPFPLSDSSVGHNDGSVDGRNSSVASGEGDEMEIDGADLDESNQSAMLVRRSRGRNGYRRKSSRRTLSAFKNHGPRRRASSGRPPRYPASGTSNARHHPDRHRRKSVARVDARVDGAPLVVRIRWSMLPRACANILRANHAQNSRVSTRKRRPSQRQKETLAVVNSSEDEDAEDGCMQANALTAEAEADESTPRSSPKNPKSLQKNRPRLNVEKVVPNQWGSDSSADDRRYHSPESIRKKPRSGSHVGARGGFLLEVGTPQSLSKIKRTKKRHHAVTNDAASILAMLNTPTSVKASS